MIMLFDQEYAIQQYGYEQKEEGREEGRILERIDIYRHEMNMDDNSIIAAIQKKFNLTPEEAGPMSFPPPPPENENRGKPGAVLPFHFSQKVKRRDGSPLSFFVSRSIKTSYD